MKDDKDPDLRIAELRKEGKSAAQIAKILAKEGYKTPTGKTPDQWFVGNRLYKVLNLGKGKPRGALRKEAITPEDVTAQFVLDMLEKILFGPTPEKEKLNLMRVAFGVYRKKGSDGSKSSDD